MIILHIACLNNTKASGVDAVVPLHIQNQIKYAKVGLINVSNIKITNIANQFDYKEPFMVNELKEPFNKPDIVVFHEAYRVQYLNIYKDLINNNIPYVIVPHGELCKDAQKIKWFKKKVANLLVFRSFINKATAIQTLSKREKNRTGFKPLKIVATNGIVCPVNKKEVFNNDKTVFSYVGRLNVFHKGIDLLLKAISLEKDYLLNNRCEFHLYGPPSSQKNLDTINHLITMLNLSNLVFLHDGIYGVNKEEVYLYKTDVFIQTSRFEGMPLGILEALGYGIPCLVTEGTTLGEMIVENEAGFYAVSNPRSIANSIKIAISSKDSFLNISRNARELVLNNFNWEKVAQDTVDCYANIVSNMNNGQTKELS